MRRRKRKLGTAALVLSCFLAGAGAGSGGDSVRPKPIQVAGGAGPLFSLRERLELRASYTGSAEGRAALESNQVRPLALISADFDEDGVADVICGYSGPVAGVLSLYSGNVYSIYPNTPAARERRQNAPAARNVVPGRGRECV